MRLGGQAGALHRAARGVLALAPGHHAVGQIDIGQPLGQLERLLEAVGQPRLDALGFTAIRSTTTSMSCLNFLSSAGASSIA